MMSLPDLAAPWSGGAARTAESSRARERSHSPSLIRVSTHPSCRRSSSSLRLPCLSSAALHPSCPPSQSHRRHRAPAPVALAGARARLPWQ
eukprot:6207483-Pleurochrysis_carterae.AAC.2